MDNENINLLKKHYNNHLYPKPIEDIKKEFIGKNKIPYADPNFSWHKLWPEKKYKSDIFNVGSLLRGKIPAAFSGNDRKLFFLEPEHTPFIFIVIGATIDSRHLRKVSVPGRRRRHPLERIGLPRVVPSLLAVLEAVEEVPDEHGLEGQHHIERNGC